MTKKAAKQPDKTIDPQGAERFSVVLKDAKDYPLLSVHEFNGVKYQVSAILSHEEGVSVGFARVNV